MKSSRVLLLSVVGLGLVAAALLISRRMDDPEPLLEAGELVARGRWHLAYTAELLGSAEERRRAQLMSSPYLAGSRQAEGRVGVTIHDPERTAPGLNLYVSGHAAAAYLITNEGHLVADWSLPLHQPFPRAPAALDYWRRAHLLPDGGLIAIYQGIGLVRIDASSQLVWALEAPAFNDLYVTPDGTIYTLTKRPRVWSSIHPSNEILEDSVTVLSRDGAVVHSVSLLEALASSPYAELLRPVAHEGDIFHSNTVTLLTAERHRPFEIGSLLISVREIDLVGILDLDSETFAWAHRGTWSRQHEPVLLASGNLLVFDNQGAAAGGTRVFEMHPLSGEVTWEYGGLSSREAGSVQRLDNGNTLITESERGRALEITTDGETVWEFLSPHRAGRDNELVATLFEVLRLPPDCYPHLSTPAE